MNFPIGGSTSKAAPKMLHCKGFVAGFYLVWYVFPVCFVPICLWPAFILGHNTYITQAGQIQQKGMFCDGIGTSMEKHNFCYKNTNRASQRKELYRKLDLTLKSKDVLEGPSPKSGVGP